MQSYSQATIGYPLINSNQNLFSFQFSRCVKAAYYCRYDLSEECLRTPISYSFNYIGLASNVPIPSSGSLPLFNLRGPSDSSTNADLSLKIANVRTPFGVPRVEDDYFYLNKLGEAWNSATVTLKKSIIGPQDIELQLKMSVYLKNEFVGFNVFRLFIYVSQNEF